MFSLRGASRNKLLADPGNNTVLLVHDTPFAEIHTVRLERGPQGFGMALNDCNRLTALDPGGPAAQSKLMRMDRILKVDGLDLAGQQLAAVATEKDAMMLTVERPPVKSYHDIAAQEVAGCKLPFLILSPSSNQGVERGRAASAPGAEQQKIDELLAGRSTHTIVLSREDAAAWPDFGIVLGDHKVVNGIRPGSPAQVAGLLVDDVVTQVNGKEAGRVFEKDFGATFERAGNNVVITVMRQEHIIQLPGRSAGSSSGSGRVISTEL